MIHLYCGDGKGKTTAAAGLALRAAGTGRKVVFAQFLKTSPSGEISAMAGLKGFTVLRMEGSFGFTFRMSPEERSAAADACEALLKKACEYAEKEDAFMLVLDEAVTAVDKGMLSEENLKSGVLNFPVDRELVMTGSLPESWMVEAADYVTDMEKIKHPFDMGTEARQGVEY